MRLSSPVSSGYARAGGELPRRDHPARRGNDPPRRESKPAPPRPTLAGISSILAREGKHGVRRRLKCLPCDPLT